MQDSTREFFNSHTSHDSRKQFFTSSPSTTVTRDSTRLSRARARSASSAVVAAADPQYPTTVTRSSPDAVFAPPDPECPLSSIVAVTTSSPSPQPSAGKHW